MGWTPDYVDTLSGLFATIAAGGAAAVTQDVAQILGRKPRSFADFVAGIAS